MRVKSFKKENEKAKSNNKKEKSRRVENKKNKEGKKESKIVKVKCELYICWIKGTCGDMIRYELINRYICTLQYLTAYKKWN